VTRDTGQVTRRQALAGALLVALVASALVALFDQLVDRSEDLPPLDAPVQPISDGSCPAPPRDRRTVVPSDHLIECPQVFDGAVLRYRGEVVRAVLHRGDHAWLQLNDDPYGLGLGPLPRHRTAVGGNSGIPVSIPADAAASITHVGDARHHGDILEVTGVFRRADPRDGGGPAIRADAVVVVQPGGPIDKPTHPARTVAAAVFAAVALALAARTYLGTPR
jgi:hypothetical protein